MSRLDLPIRAAKETAERYGVVTDRCEILQDGNTLVLRLSESLVARVVTDRDGPRQGDGWFARENAVAEHLARAGAPVIPLHPGLPPGPHERHGYTMSFWQFVQVVAGSADPGEVGRTLRCCHEVLRGFAGPLEPLAILRESLGVLERTGGEGAFGEDGAELLRRTLDKALGKLSAVPGQPLHGDAHYGNLMLTAEGVLWTDWEDTFAGPVEWDVASIIWNARILDGDEETAGGIVSGYERAGGRVDGEVLRVCLAARAAVMSAWYPVLYPRPDAERQMKLRRRLEWLRSVEVEEAG